MNIYKIITSKGDPVLFDDTEVEKVVEGLRTGSGFKLKQGIINNPNFIIDIIPVPKEKVKLDYSLGGGETEFEFDPLEDLFRGSFLAEKLLENKTKKLN